MLYLQCGAAIAMVWVKRSLRMTNQFVLYDEVVKPCTILFSREDFAFWYVSIQFHRTALSSKLKVI
jgi:hypothetical protein